MIFLLSAALPLINGATGSGRSINLMLAGSVREDYVPKS
jgi:hypothetical protein